MLGEIESNMKKTFRIKCFKLVLGVSLCFLIYLLVSLIIPPLIGTHEKSDTQAEVSITTSERVCLIDNNEDALLWRLRLIRSAQEEIILSTFDFRADSSGTDVIAALWGAAERGVQVRLIIDGINAQLHLSGSDVFQALAAHDNVEVKFYNPIRLTQLWTVNYRCHDKYLIIDRSTYLMGGRNTSDLFLGSGGTSRQNIDRDIVVYNGGFTTASANTLLEYFDRIWLLDTNRAFHAEAENHRVKKATAILARRWTEINDAKQLTAINWETETLQTNEVALLSGDCTAWNKEPMLLNTESEYIFVNDMGEPYQPNYVTQHFKLVLRKNHLRNIRFHDLRHTCASLLLKNGVPMKDIQEWLGHSSYNTTANIYAHLDTSSKNTSASKMSNVVIIEPGISTSV